MYIFQPCFKMDNIIFSLLSLCYQMKNFSILTSVKLTLSLASHPMERPTCSSLAQDYVSYEIGLVSLKMKICFTMEIFQNLVCLKPWNFPLGGMSLLHSWNPPWVPSNLPFPHCRLLLLTLSMHPIMSSSLSTFY